MAVAKLIEINAASSKSFADAINPGISKARLGALCSVRSRLR